MIGILVALQLAAQASSPLTTAQGSIIYDQCLARAAVKASRTDATEAEIYPAARADCASTRAMVLDRAIGRSDLNTALDAIDAERAVSFPERTRKVREMRAKYSQGKPQN